MPLTPKPLTRTFCYNGLDVPDPNPALTPADCLKLIAASYPELVNAKIEASKIEGGIQTFNIRPIAGEKG